MTIEPQIAQIIIDSIEKGDFAPIAWRRFRSALYGDFSFSEFVSSLIGIKPNCLKTGRENAFGDLVAANLAFNDIRDILCKKYTKEMLDQKCERFVS